MLREKELWCKKDVQHDAGFSDVAYDPRSHATAWRERIKEVSSFTCKRYGRYARVFIFFNVVAAVWGI